MNRRRGRIRNPSLLPQPFLYAPTHGYLNVSARFLAYRYMFTSDLLARGGWRSRTKTDSLVEYQGTTLTVEMASVDFRPD